MNSHRRRPDRAGGRQGGGEVAGRQAPAGLQARPRHLRHPRRPARRRRPTTSSAVITALNGLKVARLHRDGRRARRSRSTPPARRIPRGVRPPARIVLLSDGANTPRRGPDHGRPARARRASGLHRRARHATACSTKTRRATRRPTGPPDTGTLQEIARSTGGRYYNVADAQKLSEIYSGPGQPLREAAGQAAGDRGVRRRRARVPARRRGRRPRARRAAAVTRATAIPPAPERTPDRPGPGPVPQQVLRSLDLAILHRVESLMPGEHMTPQVGARHRAGRDPRLPARATTSATSTGTSPPGCRSRTCASTSPSGR